MPAQPSVKSSSLRSTGLRARGVPQTVVVAEERPLLRLALSRGGLGLELDAPFRAGPITVSELSASLVGVRFPIDLSGGVARFRHRRGQLRRLVLEARPMDLAARAAPRLRGLLGEATPEVIVAPIEAGVLVGLRSGSAALAFDLVITPIEDDIVLVPQRARGIGLSAPPHVLAMRALVAAVGPLGRVRGGAVVLEDAVAIVARHVLPAAGARVASSAAMRWDAPRESGGMLRMTATSEGGPPALSDRAIRAIEGAELAGDADALALAGDLDEARRGYLTVLERAPRHTEISCRLAEIDLTVGDRSEAALGTLVDAMPAELAGLLGSRLLEAVGDVEGARTALVRAAHDEPYGPLAGLAWMRLASLADGLGVRIDALDRAVARAPLLAEVRWARLVGRLDAGDARGARADAEHLEAATLGSSARHEVWRRAAEAFLARGFVAEAGSLYERALRYVPDSIESVAGLARSLMAARQERRALDLLARAAALAARRGLSAGAIELDLARALAEVAGDRPAAIARVRAVPPGSAASLDARLLEGRWRAEIGDLAGASVALGRLADAVDIAPDVDVDRAAAIAALLVEAAQIEENERGDRAAAQRHLGLALRLRPRDRAIAAAFRRVASELAKPARAPRFDDEPPSSETPQRPGEQVPWARVAPPSADDDDATPLSDPDAKTPRSAISDETARLASALQEAADEPAGSLEDELVVDRLSDRLRADPSDRGVVLALADVLARLGRDLDLVALLSAQIEEGDDDARAELTPRRNDALARLAAHARTKGRHSEAELYEAMLGGD